jgi:hypothetical protein
VAEVRAAVIAERLRDLAQIVAFEIARPQLEIARARRREHDAIAERRHGRFRVVTPLGRERALLAGGEIVHVDVVLGMHRPHVAEAVIGLGRAVLHERLRRRVQDALAVGMKYEHVVTARAVRRAHEAARRGSVTTI